MTRKGLNLFSPDAVSPQSIFHPGLADSEDVEPTDAESTVLHSRYQKLNINTTFSCFNNVNLN
jgi:hypothetical protein